MSRQIIDLIQFGWLGNTKSLLRDLKRQGLPVTRTKEATSGYYRPGTFENPIGGIEVGREHPVFALHHEAGHHAAQRPVERFQKSQGDKRIRWKLVGERMANRAAVRRMSPDMVEPYKKQAEKWYAGHLDWALDRTRQPSQVLAAGATVFSSLLPAIQFERVENPIFRKGVKPGIHRIGEGKERMVRIRSIVSPQWGIDEGKVRKMTKSAKLAPPVISHLGHGVYVLKDGNHRVNALLRQGKRRILARVQRL